MIPTIHRLAYPGVLRLQFRNFEVNRQLLAGSNGLVTAILLQAIFVCWGGDMLEVYLNDRRDLLVIEKGSVLPLFAATRKWRKRKKKVVRVSDEIRFAVRTQGYYMRKLSDLQLKNGAPRPGGMRHRFGQAQSLVGHH